MGAEILGISRDVHMSDVLVSYDFPPMIGGAHKWLYEIYRRWPTAVDVVAAKQHSAEIEEFDTRAHGSLKIRRVAAVSRSIDFLSPKYVFSLCQQVRVISAIGRNATQLAPGAINLHALRAFPEGLAAYAYRAMNRRNTHLITYAHGEEVLVSQTSRQLKFIAEYVYGNSDLVIANSANTQKLLHKSYPHAKSVCIHPGVDVNAFYSDVNAKNEIKKKYGWSPETVVVLTLARMELRKNHAMVIRAAALLRDKGSPISVICGGDGEQRSGLEDLAKSLGISKWVAFPGAISEEQKPNLFASADVFAMPSVTVGEMIEGFGIVFLEAAAAGLPTLCGNTGGQPEAILHGTSGFAVNGESLREVSDVLEKLVQNEECRIRLGHEGRRFAERFDWSVLEREVESQVTKARDQKNVRKVT